MTSLQERSGTLLSESPDFDRMARTLDSPGEGGRQRHGGGRFADAAFVRRTGNLDHAVLIEVLGETRDGGRTRHRINRQVADDGVELVEREQSRQTADCDEGETKAKADEQFARRPDPWHQRQRHDLCFEG
jgi:hypothetical protein